jgi:hypothetical protein
MPLVKWRGAGKKGADWPQTHFKDEAEEAER